VTTAADGHVLPTLEGRGRIGIRLDRLDLVGGEYFVNVSAHERNWTYAYDSHWHVYPVRIGSTRNDRGVLRVPHSWRFDLTGVESVADDVPAGRADGTRV
jgi:hypothetical protein